MNIDDYQVLASETMQMGKEDENVLSIVLLGLNGEVGELATEYKKKIRDGESYKIFKKKSLKS